MKYRKVCIGGTFDILHRGHMKLIKEACRVSEHLVICVTTSEFASRFKKRVVRAFEDRVRDLLNFLKDSGLVSKVSIVPTEDIYGATVIDPEIEAIVVTAESLERGFEVNLECWRRGMRLLDIVVVPMVRAEDGKPISASRILRGEIDRNGRVVKA